MAARGTCVRRHELGVSGSRPTASRHAGLGRRRGAERGATLLDAVVAAGIFAIVVGLSLPLVGTARDEQRLMSAARYLHGRIMLARADAARSGATVGIHFARRDGRFRFRAYRDGDRNGVGIAGITSGRDRPVGDELALGDLFEGVRIALNPVAPLIGAAAPAGAGADPVRLGSSDILSVTPLGTARAGTVYLRSRQGHQAAVRVSAATARVQVHWFDFRAGRWRIR